MRARLGLYNWLFYLQNVRDRHFKAFHTPNDDACNARSSIPGIKYTNEIEEGQVRKYVNLNTALVT